MQTQAYPWSINRIHSTGDVKILEVNMYMGAFSNILPDIGLSQNVNQFGILIHLTFANNIELT